MDARAEIKAFLTSRRANVTPEQAGLSMFAGGTRRVPGLRREEVALLAGVSVDYYTRLERGNAAGVSDGVLEALARALQLDTAERTHLFDLVRAARPAGASTAAPRRRSPATGVRPGVQRMLDAVTGAPAYVRNGRLDTVATNALGRALFSPPDGSGAPANHARFTFLDERSRDFYVDWALVADQTAAILRTEAGRDPFDKGMTELVGQLSTQSEDFRVRWAKRDVRLHDQGEKRFRHPVVGELVLAYEGLELMADPGLVMFTFTAEPGSRSAEGLQLLSSWIATVESEASVAGG